MKKVRAWQNRGRDRWCGGDGPGNLNVQGYERRIPGRLGLQRRRIGKSPIAGDAAVLGTNDKARHHGGDIRRAVSGSLGWILLSARHVPESLWLYGRAIRETGIRSVQSTRVW